MKITAFEMKQIRTFEGGPADGLRVVMKIVTVINFGI